MHSVGIQETKEKKNYLFELFEYWFECAYKNQYYLTYVLAKKIA